MNNDLIAVNKNKSTDKIMRNFDSFFFVFSKLIILNNTIKVKGMKSMGWNPETIKSAIIMKNFHLTDDGLLLTTWS